MTQRAFFFLGHDGGLRLKSYHYCRVSYRVAPGVEKKLKASPVASSFF